MKLAMMAISCLVMAVTRCAKSKSGMRVHTMNLARNLRARRYAVMPTKPVTNNVTMATKPVEMGVLVHVLSSVGMYVTVFPAAQLAEMEFLQEMSTVTMEIKKTEMDAVTIVTLSLVSNVQV